MITPREERELRGWLEDEPPILPTHVWYAVMEEIPSTRQRRRRALPGILDARPAARLLVAAALLLLAITGLAAAAGAMHLFRPEPPRPFPSGEVPLEAGRYVVDRPFPQHLAFDVPAGWASTEYEPSWVGLRRDRAVGPAVILTWVDGVYQDACDPTRGLQHQGSSGPTTDVAGALARLASVTTSRPASFELGGQPATYLSVSAPAGTPACTGLPDDAPYQLWGLPQAYGLWPGDRAEVWVVPLESLVLVAVVEVPAGTEDADAFAAREIVASLAFGTDAPVAAPTPSTLPTPSSVRVPWNIIPGVRLAGGSALLTVYLYDPESPEGTRAGAAYDFVVGAPAGWVGTSRGIASPDGMASIEAWTIDKIHPDPCHWQASTFEVSAYSADGIAAVVADGWSTTPGSGGPVASGMTDPPWNGHRAWLVDLRVPDDIDPASCDGGTLLGWQDPIQSSKTLEPGAAVRLRVIDLDGAPVIVAETSLPGMTLATGDALEAAAASLWIGLPLDHQPVSGP